MNVRIIAIGGSSGAGKTTLAQKLITNYGEDNCIVISSDNYYKGFGHLTPADKKKVNYDHPDSIDFARLALDLSRLKSGEAVEIPTYDFEISARKKETLKITPKKIILLEGILVLSTKELSSVLDLRIFVQTDLDLCLLRRIKRDMEERNRTMESVVEQYARTVRPMYKEFIEPEKKKSHIVVNNNLSDLNFDITAIVVSIDGMLTNQPSKERVKFTLFPNVTVDSKKIDESLAMQNTRAAPITP